MCCSTGAMVSPLHGQSAQGVLFTQVFMGATSQMSALGYPLPFRQGRAVGVWELPLSVMEGMCSPWAGTRVQTSSTGIPAGTGASAWAEVRAPTQVHTSPTSKATETRKRPSARAAQRSLQVLWERTQESQGLLVNLKHQNREGSSEAPARVGRRMEGKISEKQLFPSSAPWSCSYLAQSPPESKGDSP